jgi:hypothetical protein
MRPNRAAACAWLPPRTSVALLAALSVAGCGRGTSHRSSELTFEELSKLSDTTGLSIGRPLLTTFEPYRMTGGAMRVRGKLDLPDGTRVQITITSATTGRDVDQLQVTIQDRQFETAPFMSDRGPLPEDRYRFTLLAHFNSTWQPASVLDATDQGRRLRGPGMTRTSMGQATFILHEERRL